MTSYLSPKNQGSHSYCNRKASIHGCSSVCTKSGPNDPALPPGLQKLLPTKALSTCHVHPKKQCAFEVCWGYFFGLACAKTTWKRQHKRKGQFNEASLVSESMLQHDRVKVPPRSRPPEHTATLACLNLPLTCCENCRQTQKANESGQLGLGHRADTSVSCPLRWY